MTDDRAVIDFLAENYPTHLAARGLWERAGGRRVDVTVAETPRDMWYELWRKARTGAAAAPESLVAEALTDYPYSTVLIQALDRLAPAERLAQARDLVARLETADNTPDEGAVVGLLRTLPGGSSRETFVILAPALQGHLPETKRASLQQILERIVAAAREGATRLYSETVKAAAEGAMRALTTTQPG